MNSKAFVIGVGMTKFTRPLTTKQDYPEMAKEAGLEALRDAKIDYKKVDAVVASYCYGEPTSGQRAVYELGLTGIPMFNVNNNCSSASSALMLARHLIQSKMYNCVLALGFEKMERGLSERYPEKVSPVDRHFNRMVELRASPEILPGMNKMTSEVIKIYAYAAREYKEKYPNACTDKDFAFIAHKNRIQGKWNSKASFYQKPVPDVETIRSDRLICPPITSHQSSMTADGAACAVVCSEPFAKKWSNFARSIEIVGQQMVTDRDSTFIGGFISLSGYDMAKQAAEKCFSQANLSPKDVDVVEVHDCFSCNELFMYEALGLCPEGKGAQMLANGRWIKTKDNEDVLYKMNNVVVNPSGGLESKGHPIGATGLAQCYEIVMQLRGECGIRQVPNARVGLQHNFGIGGAAVVTLYKNNNLSVNVSKL